MLSLTPVKDHQLTLVWKEQIIIIIKLKEKEKKGKYLEKLKKLWNMNMTIINYDSPQDYLSDLGMKGPVESIETTTL